MKYILQIISYIAAYSSTALFPITAYAQGVQIPNMSTPLGNLPPLTLILILIGIVLLVWAVCIALLYFSIFKKTKRFSREQAVSSSWQYIQKRLWFFVLVMFIQYVVGMIPNIAGLFAGRVLFISNSVYFKTSITILDFAVFLLLAIGIIKIVFALIDGGRARLIDLFIHVRYFLSFLAATILYALAVLGGLILFIVPGLIAASALILYPFYIIDKNLGPIKALKASIAATKGARLDLLLMVALFIEINIIGLLSVFVGLMVTVPLTVLAFAHIYRQLAKTV